MTNRDLLGFALSSQILFNPAVAGVFRHAPLAGGGGGLKRPQPKTRELIVAARRARQQTKACDKTLQMSTYNFNFEVTSQIKVRSKIQNWTFSRMDFDTLSWAVLVITTARIVENPSLECYMSARFKQGPVKHRSGSRSAHKGKAISPIIEVCIYAM